MWFCPLPLGAIAGIVDQPMQNFQRSWDLPSSAGSTARGVISGVGKGIVGVFTKPIGGAAELVSQTGYGESRMMMIFGVMKLGPFFMMPGKYECQDGL